MKSYLRFTVFIVAGITLAALFLLGLSASASNRFDRSDLVVSLIPEEISDYGGSFRFATYEPGSLDPVDGTSDGAIIGQIFEGLTKWGDDHSPLPAIAQSWETSDAQVWTFHIRPGALFHNGREVTAEDVVFSLTRAAESGISDYGYLEADINTITALDSSTVVITLSRPFAPLPTVLALPFMSVIPPESVETINTNPIGSGPFKFQNWTAGDSIVLTYNSDYYAGRPYIDSIIFQFYGSDTEMYEDYLIGNLDLSPVPADRSNEVLDNPNTYFVHQDGTYFYGMNVDMPPFDDVRVRQAISYAVNRSNIVDNINPGYQVVADGMVPPVSEGYDPPVPSYSYDPVAALDLLAQAGWLDTNSDGILDDGAGQDLIIELWYNTSTGHEAIANAVAEDLRNIGGTGIGATVNLNDVDWATYLEELNKNQYPMFRLGWTAWPDPYHFLHPLFSTDGIRNNTVYSNAQVDSWLDQAAATLDLGERQAIYELIENKVMEDAPYLNVYYYMNTYIKSDDVLGLAIPSNDWSAGLGTIQMEKVQLFFQTHDVEFQSIIYPKATLALGEPIVPIAKVRNVGSSVETNIPVRCRILDSDQELYSQTQMVASLSPFAAMVVTFPEWMPDSAGEYTFEFTTLLEGDEDPSNDQENLTVTISALAFFDAYTQDNTLDDGSVPTTAWWQSPDIIVRNQDDGIHNHQDPILGQTNYVYVKVRNIGNASISDGYMDVYWHEPSSAILCGDWGLINPNPIPVGTLAPGESTWIKTTWVPNIEGHTCLFSRIWSGGDPVTYECDVSWDNNLAQRNLEVVDIAENTSISAQDEGQASVMFEITNIRPLPTPVDLVIERGNFPLTGTIVLELGNDLFTRWVAETGGTVIGGTMVPDTSQIEITDPVSATIIGLPMGVRETQLARIYLTGPAQEVYVFHVAELIEGEVVGGMTYQTGMVWTTYLPMIVRDTSAP